MEEKKITASDKRGSNRIRDPPSSNNRQLKTTIYKSQEGRHASMKPQSKTPASRLRDDGDESEHMELDDDDYDRDDNTKDESNGGNEDDDVIEANDQTTLDGIEEEHDARENDSVVSESESERFMKKYGTFRTYLSKATRREAETEFLRNKRELIALPNEHEQNEQQQRDQRFCTWALRESKRRIKALLEEEATRGEFSSSDGLSESDGNKSWKMYGIIAEDNTQYLIAWKGVNKITGQDHADEWTAKKNVKWKDRREWEVYKRKKANNEA
jgi:hypothetical protein